MQGSFTDISVYFDNDVHSHLVLGKCPETLVPQQKVRDFSSPHCQFSHLDKKTEVPPTANTGLSPLSHTTVLARTLSSNQKSLSGNREILPGTHHYCFFFTGHISKQSPFSSFTISEHCS